MKFRDNESGSTQYHAIIEELVLNDDGDDYEIKDQCKSEFEFEGTRCGLLQPCIFEVSQYPLIFFILSAFAPKVKDSRVGSEWKELMANSI